MPQLFLGAGLFLSGRLGRSLLLGRQLIRGVLGKILSHGPKLQAKARVAQGNATAAVWAHSLGETVGWAGSGPREAVASAR